MFGFEISTVLGKVQSKAVNKNTFQLKTGNTNPKRGKGKN